MSWKRAVLLFFGLIVLVLATTWVVLRESGVAKDFVERILAKVLVGPFDLGHARVDLGTGEVTIGTLNIAYPGDQERSLLRARDVRVSVNTNPLGDVGRVHEVVLRGVAVDELQLFGDGALRIDEILRIDDLPADAGSGYPAVIIEDSRVSLRFSPQGDLLSFADVDLKLLPVEAGSSEMVLSGSMTSSLGTAVRISGGGDIAKGRFRALVSLADGGMQVQPRMARPFSPTVADDLAKAQMAGQVAAAQLWLEYDRGLGEQPLRGGFQVDLADLSLRIAGLPHAFTGAKGRIHGRLREEGTLSARLTARGLGGDLDLELHAEHAFGGSTMRGTGRLVGKGLQVDADLLRALAAWPVTAQVPAVLTPEPTGQLDITAYARLDGEQLGTVDLDIEADGLSMSFAGVVHDGKRLVPAFPYRLTGMTGRASLRGHQLQLEDVAGVDMYGRRLTIAGRVPLRTDQADGWLHIEGRQVRFSRELRRAIEVLSEEFVGHYDTYAPQGEADVSLHLPSTRNVDAVDLRIRPLDASAEFRQFPLRVDRLRGEVAIRSDGVDLDLHGVRGDATGVDLRGRFTSRGASDDRDPESLRSELWVRARDVPLDNELHRASVFFLPALEQVWGDFSPRGTGDVEVWMWRSHGQPDPSYDVRVDLRDTTVLPVMMPLRLVEVNGSVFVHGTGGHNQTRIDAMRAALDAGDGRPGARVLIAGSVDVVDGEVTSDVTTAARGVPMDRRLAEALDAIGVFSLTAWAACAPGGHIDVISRQRSEPGGEPPTRDITVQLRDATSNAVMLPAPASGMRGEVTIRNHTITFEEVRGMVGDAPVVVRDGTIEPRVGSDGEPTTRIDVTVTADDFPVDDRLARLLGDSPLRQTYLDRRARGSARVSRLRLGFTLPGSAEQAMREFEVDFDGQLVARNVSLQLASDIDHVDGIITMQGEVDASGGRVEGAFTNLSFETLGRPVTEFSAGFESDVERMTLTDLSARLHGGRVWGAGDGPHLLYRMAGDGVLSGNFVWQGVRLSELLGEPGRPDPNISGNLAGELRLDELPGQRLLDAGGTGGIRITGGQLGEVPLFRTIYSVLKKHPQFTGAEAQFRLGDRRLDVNSFKLSSQVLDVIGRGTVRLDGYVDMTLEMPDLFGDDADWLLLPQLLHNAVSQVVEFKVHGYVGALKTVPLLLFQSAPGRLPIPPVPALLPARERPRF